MAPPPPVAVLDDELWFPEPSAAPGRGPLAGLVAVGGDMTVDRLLLAYQTGVFPWSVNPLTWWSPDPRALFELDHFHIPRSLRRTLRLQPFRVTRDTAFDAVMRGCARSAPGRRSTWISPEFIEAYAALHRSGHAHSVECWAGNDLVGGIYGVAAGGLFAGESMFHRATDASKIALCHLVDHLRERGFALFDIQMMTPVTRRLGATEVPRREYLHRLKRAIALDCAF